MSKKYFAILAIVILGISMSFGSSALAAMTYGATTATSDGNYTLDGITSSVVSLGPSVTTGSFAMGAGLTTGSVTIGGTSMAAGATTIYGGTGTGAISLTPGTAGTIQIGSAGSGAVTITPATTVTGLLTTTAGITSGSNIKSDTDSTDSLGLTGTRWASTFSDNFTGNTIALDGATGVNTLTITDAVADGLSIIRGSTDVIVINTTTPSVTITPATTVTGLLTTTAGITSGSNIKSDTTSTDSLGLTGTRWASTFSDNFTGNTIALDGATGVNTLTITDAVADGLSIIRGSTDVIVINTSTPSVTITPATIITGALTANGSVTLGDAIADTTIINGRVSTTSVAGAVINVGADYTYSEGMEIRYGVDNWTLGNSFKGAYFRGETSLGNASGGLRGMEIYGVSNITSGTTGLNQLQSLYTEMLVKSGSGARTITSADSIEANVSIDNQAATLTFTNNVYALKAKVQTGTGIADYTKMNGIAVMGRDDGTARTFGNAISIVDPEATVATWTKGLSVSAATTTAVSLTGTMTTGISVGTATTGLTFPGGYTTAAVQLGTSGSKMTLAAADDYAVDINTTSASTSGSASVQPFHMISTMTGVGGVGGRALFEMDTEAVLGGWANALKGYTNFGTNGSVTGLGSAVVAEMKMPGKTLTAGTYAPLEIELVTQASGATGGTPVSFIYAQLSGADATAKTDMATTGSVLNLAGMEDVAGGMFEAEVVTAGNVDFTHVLKIIINGTPYYIGLNTAKTF